MISVLCKFDKYLHLAPEAADNRGLGVSKFTLCLEKWKDYAPNLVDAEAKFCPLCAEAYQKRLQKGAQQ